MENPEINLEKVHLLINKLQQLSSVHTDQDLLLPTAQMLVAALQQVQKPGNSRTAVSVIMPGFASSNYDSMVTHSEHLPIATDANPSVQQPAEITEEPPEQAMDKEHFEAEQPAGDPLKNIEEKKHLEFIHENFSAWTAYNIPAEAPTLVQNDIKNEQGPDINDHLKEDKEEWVQTLQSTPIENLANAIGINDRYLYISELFRGDESMYERSIVTLNKFHNYEQAHAWAERELRLKLGWDTENLITRQFEQLIKRRFMQ